MQEKILLANVSENREAWLELRKKLITASEAFDAADINEAANPFRVYLKLAGLTEGQQKEQSEAMYWGNVLENVVAEEFCRAYVRDHPGAAVSLINPDALYGHPTLEWAGATPDRFVTIDGELCNLQCKTTNAFNLQHWDEGKIPDYVRAQVLHEMGCLPSIYRSFVATLILSPTFRYVEVPREDQFIELLFERERKVWEAAQTKTPPPIKTQAEVAELRAAFWSCNEEVVTLDHSMLDVMRMAKTWAAIEKYADEQKRGLTNSVLQAVGNGAKGRCGDWKVSVVRSEFDDISVTELRAQDPKLYAELQQRFGRTIKRYYPTITPPKEFKEKLEQITRRLDLVADNQNKDEGSVGV